MLLGFSVGLGHSDRQHTLRTVDNHFRSLYLGRIEQKIIKYLAHNDSRAGVFHSLLTLLGSLPCSSPNPAARLAACSLFLAIFLLSGMVASRREDLRMQSVARKG